MEQRQRERPRPQPEPSEPLCGISTSKPERQRQHRPGASLCSRSAPDPCLGSRGLGTSTSGSSTRGSSSISISLRIIRLSCLGPSDPERKGQVSDPSDPPEESRMARSAGAQEIGRAAKGLGTMGRRRTRTPTPKARRPSWGHLLKTPPISQAPKHSIPQKLLRQKRVRPR
jgi:hypothetical protein